MKTVCTFAEAFAWLVVDSGEYVGTPQTGHSEAIGAVAALFDRTETSVGLQVHAARYVLKHGGVAGLKIIPPGG